MAVAWRSISLILLMVASFQLATIVQAQTDYSFDRWFEARERLAKAQAAEQGISVGGVLPERSNPLYLLYESTPAQQRRAHFEQFENDKAEAAERGTTVEAVLAERLAQRASASKLAEAEAKVERAEAAKKWATRRAIRRAKANKLQAIQLAVTATIAFAVIMIVFKARRRIAATISPRWRRKSRVFRVWAFGSACWAVGAILYIWLNEPYGWRIDYGHMFGVMIVPPLFLGAVWLGYKRFVDLQVKAEPQRVISDEDDTEDRED